MLYWDRNKYSDPKYILFKTVFYDKQTREVMFVIFGLDPREQIYSELANLITNYYVDKDIKRRDSK